jgi:hypothetical protein
LVSTNGELPSQVILRVTPPTQIPFHELEKQFRLLDTVVGHQPHGPITEFIYYYEVPAGTLRVEIEATKDMRTVSQFVIQARKGS